MYIVDFTGAKIELELDEAAHQAIHALLLRVQMEGGVGLVLPYGLSYKLELHDWDEKEADAIQKNIAAGDPPKHRLPWSAKDYAELSERFRTDHSTTFKSLAKEFGRTPSGIQNQLQQMRLVDHRGEVTERNRMASKPRKKCIYGIPSSGTMG